MADTTIPYQIVIFTRLHSINGGIFLREKRFSDFMNDPRDTSVMLRSATVARLENPAKILKSTMVSFIPKAWIVLAFEPPQKGPPQPARFIKYPKDKHEVIFITDGMDGHGTIHIHGPIDMVHVLTNADQHFLPVTQASVNIDANPDFKLKNLTILVNTQRIRFIGEVQPKSPTEPRP